MKKVTVLLFAFVLFSMQPAQAAGCKTASHTLLDEIGRIGDLKTEECPGINGWMEVSLRLEEKEERAQFILRASNNHGRPDELILYGDVRLTLILDPKRLESAAIVEWIMGPVEINNPGKYQRLFASDPPFVNIRPDLDEVRQLSKQLLREAKSGQLSEGQEKLARTINTLASKIASYLKTL